MAQRLTKVAKHLRRVMELRGINVYQLAKITGINKVQIYRWLGRCDQKARIQATNAQKLARALGVTVESVLFGDE